MRRFAVVVLFLVLCFGASGAQATVVPFLQAGQVSGFSRTDGDTNPLTPSINFDFGVVARLAGDWLWGVKIGVATPETVSYYSPRLFVALGHRLGQNFLIVMPVGVQYGPEYFGKKESILLGGGFQLGYKLVPRVSVDFAVIGGTMLVRGAANVDFVLAFKPSFTFTLPEW